MLEQLKQNAIKEIEEAENSADLETAERKYLGRQGELTEFIHSLGTLAKQERKEQGRLANQIKNDLTVEFSRAKKKFAGTTASNNKKDWIDITAPGIGLPAGHLHPLSLVQKEIEDIFQSMGFSVVYGPEMETEYYNFDALNIPKDHPARDIWDTFWLKNDVIARSVATKQSQKNMDEIASLSLVARNDKKKAPRNDKKDAGNDNKNDGGLLLRTHTSPVQARYMEKHRPPLRIIAPGRVFRHEATDASHDAQFYQIEGLMTGTDVSVANFKAMIEQFFKRFFGKETETRLRPSYFPFVEPGFEIDIRRPDKDWLEIMGAGMVHPNVFKAVGYPASVRQQCQGFAFGAGLDRLAMMKYKIDDIRLFYGGDLRFIEQF